MELEVLHDPSATDAQQVVRRLVAWNLTVAPPEEHRRLLVVARDGHELVGGIAGHTHSSRLFVSPLWVADHHRGSGLGRQLMRTAEGVEQGRLPAAVLSDEERDRR